MPDEKAKEVREERDEKVKEQSAPVRRPLAADRPGDAYASQSVEEGNDLRVKARRMDDAERRRLEAEEQGEAEKYVVTEATPSSGGVYPPSAVVDPFPPDVVATHTPGEQEPEETDPQTGRLKGQKQPDTVDPQTPASVGKKGDNEPAAHATPAQ